MLTRKSGRSYSYLERKLNRKRRIPHIPELILTERSKQKPLPITATFPNDSSYTHTILTQIMSQDIISDRLSVHTVPSSPDWRMHAIVPRPHYIHNESDYLPHASWRIPVWS